jgi:hypothetical protein
MSYYCYILCTTKWSEHCQLFTSTDCLSVRLSLGELTTDVRLEAQNRTLKDHFHGFPYLYPVKRNIYWIFQYKRRGSGFNQLTSTVQVTTCLWPFSCCSLQYLLVLQMPLTMCYDYHSSVLERGRNLSAIFLYYKGDAFLFNMWSHGLNYNNFKAWLCVHDDGSGEIWCSRLRWREPWGRWGVASVDPPGKNRFSTVCSS